MGLDRVVQFRDLCAVVPARLAWNFEIERRSRVRYSSAICHGKCHQSYQLTLAWFRLVSTCNPTVNPATPLIINEIGSLRVFVCLSIAKHRKWGCIFKIRSSWPVLIDFFMCDGERQSSGVCEVELIARCLRQTIYLVIATKSVKWTMMPKRV